MQHIVIDGYNYLNRIRATPIDTSSSIEILRKAILDRLVRYKKIKTMRLTVVFDAYNSYSVTRQREEYMGIDIVYSKKHETADDVIIDLIRKRPSGLIVVTSDRKIIDEAKFHGVSFLTPSGFDALMHREQCACEKAEADEGQCRRGKKAGNPKRLPKKVRRALKNIGKI